MSPRPPQEPHEHCSFCDGEPEDGESGPDDGDGDGEPEDGNGGPDDGGSDDGGAGAGAGLSRPEPE